MEAERELKHVKEERETVDEEASHLEMRESKKGGKGRGIGKRVISVVGKHFVYFEPDDGNKKGEKEKESGGKVIDIGGEPTVFFKEDKENKKDEKQSGKEVLIIEGEPTVVFKPDKGSKKDEQEKGIEGRVLNMEGEPTVFSELEENRNGKKETESGEEVIDLGEPTTVYFEPEEEGIRKDEKEIESREKVITLGGEPTSVYFEPEEDDDLTDDTDFSYIGDDHGDYFTEDNLRNAKVDYEATYTDNLENVAAEEVDQKLENGIQEYGSNASPSSGSKYVDEITRIGHEIQETYKLEPEKSTKFIAEEYDLERIIEEQETHDLYCPNCHSCITRTVILRKRKRTYREIQNDISVDDGQHVPDFTPAPTETVEHEDKTAFRCLSCFSFFIPTDGGFNIFKMFGKKNGNGNLRNAEKLPEKNVNSASSLFGISSTNNKISKEGTGEQGNKQSVVPATVRQAPSGKTAYYNPGFEGNKAQIDEHSIPVKVISEDSFAGASYSNSVGNQTEGNTRNYPAITISDGISTNKGNIDGSTITIEYIPRGNDATKPASNIQSASLTESVQSNANIQDSETSVAADTVIDLGVQGIESSRSSYDLDSLKSVVYGGLIESITSLSVVSSAAGAGSSTSHIGTLGLANLVGGLFLICHDLSELHESHDEEVCNQGHPEKSQYFKKLGKREHWKRHAFITILSYIIFGSLPPIVYAFSFRSSDNQNLKIIAMASSSLFFISLLALGKAHARPKKGYIKSLFYYLAIAIPASGLSFVAGVLLDKLFVKLGLFKSNLVPPSPPSLFEPLSYGYGSGYGEWQEF